MILKSRNLLHAEEHINRALGVDDAIMIQCRERILFSYFANSLQAVELFSDRESAPKELVTVTGDLQRCLKLISSQEEYEITLLHFMSYHSLAQQAWAHWNIKNNATSDEDGFGHELIKMIMKLKEAHDKEKAEDEDIDDGINGDLRDIQNVVKRIDEVKKCNYSFSKYMQAMGYNIQTPDVDDILRNLFSDDARS